MDLQNQIISMKRSMRKLEQNMEADEESEPENGQSQAVSVKRILWVDDTPSNNSFEVDYLKKRGYTVDLALTTNDGLKQFNNKPYDIVISDLGRKEDNRYITDAGIKLSEMLRNMGAKVPIYIYTSTQGLRQRDEAINKGATALTTSPTHLMELIG